jgi:hypothetical protein
MEKTVILAHIRKKCVPGSEVYLPHAQHPLREADECEKVN